MSVGSPLYPRIEAFDWVEYFGSEGLGCIPLAPFEWLYLRLFRPEELEARRLPEITLADLSKWAEQKCWKATTEIGE